MPDSPEEIERFFAVGRIAVLQTEPQRKDGPRFATSFVGWRRGRSIFIEHPRTPDGREVAFRDAQHCVVRFLHDGQACAFSTEVLEWGSGRGEGQVRLRWPADMERLVLRRHDRVAVSCPCKLMLSSGHVANGKLHDLSMAGCGLEAHVVATKGDHFQISFVMPDGASVENIRATVRAVRAITDGCRLGCEFEPGQDRARNDVALFVNSELARGRFGSCGAGPRVLIVDSNADFAEKLLRFLGRQKIEAVSVSCTIDAMHAVRALPLGVVLVSQEMGDLPGLEICRLVRLARGLDMLPLILYGGDAAVGEAAMKYQVRKWMPADSTLLADLAFEAKGIIQSR